MIGIFLILFGALMLLDNLGWIDLKMGDYILPVLLIALGGSMLMRKRGSTSSKHPKPTTHPK